MVFGLAGGSPSPVTVVDAAGLTPGTGLDAAAGTLFLAAIADTTILANISGGSASPTPHNITTAMFGSNKLGVANGGTNLAAYTVGDLIYASGTTTLSKLAINTTATKKFLSATSSALSYGILAAADIPFAAPGAIGGGTPGAGTFTTLTANTTRAYNGAVTTVAGSAGNLYWSMPETGSGLKKVVIVLDGYSAAGTTTITFPTAFLHTPDVFKGGTITLSLTAPTTTQIVIPISTLQTGTITIEGI